MPLDLVTMSSQRRSLVHLLMPLCCFLSISKVATFHQEYKLVINSSDVRGKLNHFWESTGFCPPKPHEKASDFDLSEDMHQNLGFIAAVPHGGIKQVRIHWLLSLVKVESFDKGGNPIYNFNMLDEVIDLLWKNDLRPGFELMGNPSNFFTDFDNITQVYLWRDFIGQVANRYVNIYGLGYVRTWNFETWNEPDCKDFDDLHISVEGFLRYYDACSEGLRSVSPLLVFGGPGDGCHRTTYSDALLQHVVSGINFFTGEKGVRLNFLSFHKKGNGTARNILSGELGTIYKIRLKFPSLVSKPFYNDEADPLVGWSKDEEWRADSRYAAMATKIIVQHQNIILSNPSKSNKNFFNFSLLSNDNGFLSWYPHQFTERTLLARFQMNNTKPAHVQMVRKSIHSAMVLMSLLGDLHLHASLTSVSEGHQVANDSNVGVLCTVHKQDTVSPDSWQMTVILYNSNDTSSSGNEVKIWIDIVNQSIPGSDHIIAGYFITDSTETPYSLWKQWGKPKFPTISQFKEMRKVEGPSLFLITPFKKFLHSNEKQMTLPVPSIVLLHVCARSLTAPDQVASVTIRNITSGQVLITWSDSCVNSKCILTYEVEHSVDRAGAYKLINENKTIVTAFVYVPVDTGLEDQLVYGYYRVRAVDYWKRAGQYSLPVKYPNK